MLQVLQPAPEHERVALMPSWAPLGNVVYWPTHAAVNASGVDTSTRGKRRVAQYTRTQREKPVLHFPMSTKREDWRFLGQVSLTDCGDSVHH